MAIIKVLDMNEHITNMIKIEIHKKQGYFKKSQTIPVRQQLLTERT